MPDSQSIVRYSLTPLYGVSEYRTQVSQYPFWAADSSNKKPSSNMSFIDTYDIERMARDMHSAGIHLADSCEDWLKLMMSMTGVRERLLDFFKLLVSMSGQKYSELENRRE